MPETHTKETPEDAARRFAREAESLKEKLRQTEDRLAQAMKEASEAGHVIIESGVIPGVSYSCRCDECRAVAKHMADAGYLTHFKDRWWESGDSPDL